MQLLRRILRVVAAALLGLIIVNAAQHVLMSLPYSLLPPWNLFATILFSVITLPRFLFFGTLPLLLVLAAMERFAVRDIRAYLALWIAGGVALSGVPILFPRLLVATSLAAALAGLVYWRLAGRMAGDLGEPPRSAAAKVSRSVVTYAVWAAVAFIVFQISGYVRYGAKLVWVSYVEDPAGGSPPIEPHYETARKKVAIMDFPDAASCLEPGASDLSVDNLKKLNWDRIDNDTEAEVCTQRLLSHLGDIAKGAEWLEAQGFEVHRSPKGMLHRERRDGSLSLTASYLIHKHGPKFPTRGFIRRAMASIPWGMQVETIWSYDGKRVLRVEYQTNTL